MQVGDIEWKLSEEGEPEIVMMFSKSYNDMYVSPLCDNHIYLRWENTVTKIWSVPTSSDEFQVFFELLFDHIRVPEVQAELSANR